MTGLRRRGWYRLRSLRARMVLITTALVVVLVTLGGICVVSLVQQELVEGIDETAEMRAEEVTEWAQDGHLPATLPGVGNESAVLVLSDGRALGATANLEEDSFGLPPQPPGTSRVLELGRLPIDESGPWRVHVLGFETDEGPGSVYVAMSRDGVDDLVEAASNVGALGLAVLVVVLCVIVWVIIGRTLAPVEAIRAHADAISGKHLDLRVPEPAQLDEIGRLARTVNAMLARLQDSSERQRTFVADAAHELRSPIASLRAQLETAGSRRLSRGSGNSDATALVDDLLAETVRMQTLVEELLLLARTDAGTAPARRLPVDLDDLVDTVAASCRVGTRVPVDLGDVDPVQVIGDPDLLEHLVGNLLENAVRYARSHVRVGVHAEGGHAVLTVDDDGAGIPVEHREEVFRRFTRLDGARDRGRGGVGLGLAIVADIAQLHGGSVEATGSPEGGARLRVWLRLSGAGTSQARKVEASRPLVRS